MFASISGSIAKIFSCAVSTANVKKSIAYLGCFALVSNNVPSLKETYQLLTTSKLYFKY
jgi:hypothetical protein